MDMNLGRTMLKWLAAILTGVVMGLLMWVYSRLGHRIEEPGDFFLWGLVTTLVAWVSGWAVDQLEAPAKPG